MTNRYELSPLSFSPSPSTLFVSRRFSISGSSKVSFKSVASEHSFLTLYRGSPWSQKGANHLTSGESGSVSRPDARHVHGPMAAGDPDRGVGGFLLSIGSAAGVALMDQAWVNTPSSPTSSGPLSSPWVTRRASKYICGLTRGCCKPLSRPWGFTLLFPPIPPVWREGDLWLFLLITSKRYKLANADTSTHPPVLTERARNRTGFIFAYE